MSFDDELRSKLQSIATPDIDASMAVLHELEPRMRRARAMRHVGSVTAAATVVMIVGLGGLALRTGPTGQTLNSPSGTLPGTPPHTNTPPDTDTRTDERGTPPATDARHAEKDDVVVVSATPEVDATVVSASGPLAQTSRRKNPWLPAPAPTAPAPTAPAPTAAPAPVPTAAPAPVPASPTTPPPSTTAEPVRTQYTVPSSCGSIVVERFGYKVSLISTSPDNGIEVDVKNDGPEEVEVGFAGHGAECELKVKVRDGELKIDVDNHED